MKAVFLLFLLTIACLAANAQYTAPHLTGKVLISRQQGLLQGQFTLSNLPALGKNYRLLLNRGLNLKLLRDETGQVVAYDGFYDSKLQGEAVAYLPMRHNDTLALGRSLRVSYVGAFPVYRDTLNAFDFKGFIAFNGQTLRATEQTKWYPTLYDVKQDRELSDVTYDITVECPDCQAIYLNGSPAQPGPVARFTSRVPRPLLLFAGNYPIQRLSTSTFLNASLTPPEAAVFNQNIAAITGFYARYLREPYGEQITFLEHQAVEPYANGRSWGFVTYPTIAVAGTSFKQEVNVKTGLLADTGTYHFYAHELAHYYFGQLLQPNATLKWFFTESTAEFLAVKATEAKYGKRATAAFIARQARLLRKATIIPLATITKPGSIDDTYRYHYGPLLLLAMEKQFGAPKVSEVLRLAVQARNAATDYAFLRQLTRKAGISEADWQPFERQVLSSTDCNAIFPYLQDK